ncbi:MAG: DUF4255 domain-containing protein [Acidobacteriota bacterium]|nr:DUF4255 domain-containing protein [Acidobacteriota bacterium]
MPIQTTIGDVTHTLTSLLKDGQDPAFFEVTSVSPADFGNRSDGKPLVNLFLFHLEPNPMKPGASRQVTGQQTRRREALELHLFYLMTALANDLADEHRALGTAMSILHGFTQIEPDRLKGALAHREDALKLDLCAYTIEDQTRIWGALGSTYRLGIFYRVRVVALDTGIEIITPRTDRVDNTLRPALPEVNP